MLKYITKYKNYLTNKFNISKTISSGIILGFGSVSVHATKLLRNIILTRILMPEVFGVMAIVLATNEAASIITNMGINLAIIQSKNGKKEEFLNISFYISFLRGIILYTILYFLSPFIASFYDNPELLNFLRVVFLGIIFSSLISPRVHILVKEMHFKKWVIIQNFGTILAITITIILSYYFRNIWSLVIGFTLEAFFRLVLSYLFTPFIPRFKFEKSLTKELMHFVKGMIGLGLLLFIFHRGEIFVIGKLCSQYELGLYAIALSLASAPLSVFSQILDKIGLSKFSQIQDSNEKSEVLLISLTRFIVYFVVPPIFFFIFFSKDLLYILYGSKYADVAIPFTIAYSTVVLRLVGLPITQIFFSKGMSELVRYFSIIRLIIFVILIYPLTKHFGIIGAASTPFLAMFVTLIYRFIKIKSLFKYNLTLYLKVYILPLFLSIIALIVWYQIDLYFTVLFQKLFLGTIVIIIIYMILIYKYKKMPVNIN